MDTFTLLMLALTLLALLALYWVNNPWKLERRFYWRELCVRRRQVLTIPLPRGWSLKICGPELLATALDGEHV